MFRLLPDRKPVERNGFSDKQRLLVPDFVRVIIEWLSAGIKTRLLGKHNRYLSYKYQFSLDAQYRNRTVYRGFRRRLILQVNYTRFC